MKMKFAIFAVLALMTALFANETFVYVEEFRGSGGRGELNFSFSNPVAVALGDDGLIYVGDSSLGGIYGLNSTDHVVRMIGKSGGTSEFSIISDVLYYDGKPYIVDRGGNRVYEYVHGSGVRAIGPPKDLLKSPSAIKIENGTMWALNTGSNRVIEYNIDRSYLLDEYLSSGIGNGKINNAKDFDFDENYVYIADTDNDRVEIYTRNFEYFTSVSNGKGGITITQPRAVTVDGEGRIFVSDWTNGRIVVFDIGGNVLETFGEKGAGIGQFDSPEKMVFSKNGTLYIVDRGNDRIVAYTLDWSANTQNSISRVDSANASVQKYKLEMINVMDKLGISYSTFSSSADIQKAYALIAEQKYGDATTSALRAVEKLSDRRKMDEQTIGTKMQKLFGNISFGLDYYSRRELGLSDEKAHIEMSAKFDESKTALESKSYAQAVDLAIEIRDWIEKMEKKDSAGDEDVATPVSEQAPKADREVLIANKAANMQVDMEKLQKRAEDAYVFANFETVDILIGTSLELAKVGAYDEADVSLGNARDNLDEIDAKVAQKESEIAAVRVEIEEALAKIESMGIPLDSAIGEEIYKAELVVVEDPAKAQEMIMGALKKAEENNKQNTEIGYALAAVIGAFVAVVIMGALAGVYIMQRAKDRKDSLGEVDIKFAKTEDEKRFGKRRRR